MFDFFPFYFTLQFKNKLIQRLSDLKIKNTWHPDKHDITSAPSFKVKPIKANRNYSLVISVYLSSLPVAYLSHAPRGRLVVTGDSARIQDETTESFAWFFNVLGEYLAHWTSV